MANLDRDRRGTSSPTRATLGGFQNFFYTKLRKPFTWESPHAMISKTVLDSGFQVLYSSSLCQWNLDSRFQSLVGLRIPWAVFWIPKPIRFRIHYPVRWRISYYYMAESVFAMHHACTRSSWRASLSFAVFFQRPTKESLKRLRAGHNICPVFKRLHRHIAEWILTLSALSFDRIYLKICL